jgi:hypothetical protein
VRRESRFHYFWFTKEDALRQSKRIGPNMGPLPRSPPPKSMNPTSGACAAADPADAGYRRGDLEWKAPGRDDIGWVDAAVSDGIAGGSGRSSRDLLSKKIGLQPVHLVASLSNRQRAVSVRIRMGGSAQGARRLNIAARYFRLCEGFRPPAPQDPIAAHGGRRPKTSRGLNRSPREESAASGIGIGLAR